MMKSPRRNLLVAVIVGIFLLGLLSFGASLQQNSNPEPADTEGPTSPDGMPFRGPTAPPPSNPDYAP